MPVAAGDSIAILFLLFCFMPQFRSEGCSCNSKLEIYTARKMRITGTSLVNIESEEDIQYNTIKCRLMAQKHPSWHRRNWGLHEKKKLNNIAYWKRQEDESFLSYFMIAEKHKFH